MYTTLFFAAGLLGLVQAQSYTPPGAQTFGSLYTPDVSHPVTQGQTFKVTWDPKGHTTDGSTVSLVLCKGGSGNCVNAPTAIASGIPAVNAQYDWAVPCSLAPGVQSTDTGYGMLIIVDGTGEFQFLAGPSCGSSSSSTTSMKSSTTTPKTTYTTTADASSSWTAWAGYNTTTSHTTSHYISTTQKPTVPATQTVPMITTIKVSTTTPAAIASASVFKGAASQFGASAAALVLAAGAAVLAL